MSDFIDWDFFSQNYELYSPQAQAMWLQILRPEVQEDVKRIRDEWCISRDTGLPAGYQVPDNLSMNCWGNIFYFDDDVRYMLMEYFEMPIEYFLHMKYFVLFGIPLPDKNMNTHALRVQAKKQALGVVRKINVQSKDDLKQLCAKCVDTMIFIDPDRRKIIIEQNITSPAEEIQAMMPVIEAYKKLGVKLLGDTTRVGSKKSSYASLIDVFISQSLESGHLSNEDVIVDTQCRFKLLYPNISIGMVKEFKINKNGKYTAMNKRIQRVRKMISGGHKNR